MQGNEKKHYGAMCSVLSVTVKEYCKRIGVERCSALLIQKKCLVPWGVTLPHK